MLEACWVVKQCIDIHGTERRLSGEFEKGFITQVKGGTSILQPSPQAETFERNSQKSDKQRKLSSYDNSLSTPPWTFWEVTANSISVVMRYLFLKIAITSQFVVSFWTICRANCEFSVQIIWLAIWLKALWCYLQYNFSLLCWSLICPFMIFSNDGSVHQREKEHYDRCVSFSCRGWCTSFGFGRSWIEVMWKCCERTVDGNGERVFERGWRGEEGMKKGYEGGSVTFIFIWIQCIKWPYKY